MASTVVSLRVGSEASAAMLVLTLVHYARRTSEHFDFGPLEYSEIQRDGITLRGNVAGVLKEALRVPGVVQDSPV